ncbi:hypothetical protein IIB79_03425 [candidate division KSB1 bacterium]|nr:hypothetical protein [candidate division KSB1 bacterium]
MCDRGSTGSNSQEILYNIVEHELSFGGESDDLEKEFILAWPFGIAVMDNGDILVADENRIKVFDSSGNGKLIVGNPGEGPGEFDKHLYYSQLTVNLSGKLTVNGSDRFYVFSPIYEFVETGGRRPNPKQKLLLDNSNLLSEWFVFRRLVYLNENEKIYSMYAHDVFSQEDQSYTDFLICETPDTLFVIKKANGTGFLKEARIDLPAVLGRVMFAQLPGDRIIYTHSGHDKKSRVNRNAYLLNVISLDTFEERTIDHNYDIIEIDYESVINSKGNELIGQENLAKKNILNDYLREKKFYPPVQKILYDNGVIFVFTYNLNEKGEVFTDIFDAETLRYLRSAYFPGFAAKAFDMEEHSTIKNGYLYYLKSGREVFAEIHKYKINSDVYRK